MCWRKCSVVLAVIFGVACGQNRTLVSLQHGTHENGKARQRIQLIDGFPHGEAIGWHPNGQVSYRGEFRDGKRHGLFQYWDENGTWVRSELFVSGSMLWKSETQKQAPHLDVYLAEAKPRVSLKDDYVGESMLLRSARKTPMAAIALPESSHGNGIEISLALQSVKDSRGELDLRRQLFSGRIPLALLGLPKFSLYGSHSKIWYHILSYPRFEAKDTLELGARWQTPIPNLRIRFGLAWSPGSETGEQYLAGKDAQQMAISDLIYFYPQSYALRAALSYRGHNGLWQWFFDGGYDLARGIGDEETGLQTDGASYLRGSFGLGVGTEQWSVMAQVIANVALTTSEVNYLIRPHPRLNEVLMSDEGPGKTRAAIGVTGEFRWKWFSPFVSLNLPRGGELDSVVVNFGGRSNWW